MATASPDEDRSNEATVTSVSELATIDSDSHNALLDRAQVNGDAASTATDELENKHISDIVDDLVNSAEVSVSGGSDTEAARSDVAKLRDEEKSHGRSSSTVKKPASFKSISVNKTFLNTKGASGTASLKPADKAVPAASLTPPPGATSSSSARPRLVAKSGSGLVAKTASGLNGGKAGAVPDPNAVWNKNRPVPPPEPKKYTDEELKKYGIHMATRLQADDSKSGQANWADEEEDEDWAPDTITWKDGTQIAIPHPEDPPPAPAPVPPPTATPTPPPVAAPPPPVREISIPEKSRSPAPPASSPSIKSGVLASGKGLVLKGAPEKPTLVAKPPAPPTPVKSPWATLPKIDKQPPIGVELQAGPPGTKYYPRDGYPPTTMTPPPPKEIAADDFSRTLWREGPPPSNRELFNSQSGRYEPVPDRRGSMRQEPSHGRQPALLQRNDTQGPAEPSAAFQTSRTSEQHPPYGRRRGSSNVSGGSGSYQHLRKGYDQPYPPPEFSAARRPSLAGDLESPTSPANFAAGPPGQRPPHVQNWNRASPASTHATPIQTAAQPVEGRVPVPPQAVPSITEQDYETQKKVMRQAREEAVKRRLEEEAREEAARKERIRLKLEAMGPAPESNSSRKAAGKSQGPAPQIQARPGSSQAPSADDKNPSDTSSATLASSDVDNKSDSRLSGVPSPSMSSKEPADARPQQGHAWPNEGKSADRFTSSSSWTQPSAKNVWGAPNNNRSLGNGTFSVDLGSSQISQIPTKAGPGPIGPPSSATQSSSGTARQPPIGPPPRMEQAPGSQMSASQRQSAASHWVAQVKTGDDAFRAILSAQTEDRDRRLKLEGRNLADIQPQIKDSWRPTKLDDEGRRVEESKKEPIHRGQSNPWASRGEGKAATLQQSQAASGQNQQAHGSNDTSSGPSTLGSGNASTRASRFFPSKDIRNESAMSPSDAHRPKSPSPPPPDMAGHPAFDGDVGRPQVSLPPQRPIVRLPPASNAATPGSLPPPRGAPSFGWASHQAYHGETGPTGHHPPIHSPGNDWEAKIKGLFDDRRPAKPQHVQASPVLVSFPLGSFRSLASGRDGSKISKVMAEECFEEQEMGSLPPIRLPKKVPDLAWQPCPAPKNVPKRFAVADILSAEPFPPDGTASGVNSISILFPGMDAIKTIGLPSSRTRSNPRRARGGGRHNGQSHRPPKSRDASSFNSESGGSGSSGQPRESRRGGMRGRDWSRTPSTSIQA
ncbi:hypothetical protein GQ53DRAFT_32616 [Thozetella sp. PMI_491]|nr:hypothetical protein GQ53DRAFT_32616 [Thozetella sp. PMI_491]